MKCEIINTGVGRASENMAFDAALFKEMFHRSHPILHLYDWKRSSLTYGYFIREEDFFLDANLRNDWDIARRSTGGGIVFHNGDFAFSFFMPSHHVKFSREIVLNYRFVNSCLVEVFRKFFGETVVLTSGDGESDNEVSRNFCMAKITKYDVVLDGKKVGGAAQRTSRHGFLHQGTMFLSRPSEKNFHDVFKSDIAEILFHDFGKYSFFPLGEEVCPNYLEEVRKELRQDLIEIMKERL
ncbi:MAG: hypothetical protein RSB82_02400 [Victivallaceae bacterium]